ncbi:MAG: TIGR03943 family protein [Spirochaetaceae bacterium]|nr:TIGR03943 family protein [Spirochaetaceae bacterium]
MRGLDRSRLLAAVVLYGIVAILLHRLLSGTLVYYINQRYAWLTWIAVAGLGAMALALAGTAWRGARHAGRSGHGVRVRWSALAVLALPVAFGLAPEQPLGSAALGNREVAVASLPPTALQSTPAGRATRSAAAEALGRSMLEWLVEFHVADDPDRFAGQEARITGFVSRDSALRPDQVRLSRFLLSCCVADAMPIAIVAEAAELALVPDDQWLTVRGRFTVAEIGGERMPILVAVDVEPIDPPPVPYLYY